jgi:hypothetical protein
MSVFDGALDGETLIDDISGLKTRIIKTRAELSAAEAKNINRVIRK